MTMTTEETVAPEQTLNALEPTQTAPEVVTPEVEAEKPADEQQAEPPKEDDAEKARRAMQRRIDKRTADLYRERAEKEHLSQRLAALEARISGEPEQQPTATDVESRAREIATVERVTEKANSIAQEGEKRFKAEFRAALETVVEESGPLFNQRGMPTALGEAILDSDDAAALLHHLGQNPDLAAELSGLSPAQLGRRIARVEAQMTAKPVVKTSNAPAPITPVGTRGSAQTSLANADFAEYKKQRLAMNPSWKR
jgi:hypothetical protein